MYTCCRAEMQVRTTRDYCTDSWLWYFLSGGLNHQTAHHLFPGKTIIRKHGIAWSQFKQPAATILQQLYMEVHKIFAGKKFTDLFAYIYSHINYPFNIRTAQDSDVEPIVPGTFRSFNFRVTLYDTKNHHHTKITHNYSSFLCLHS